MKNILVLYIIIINLIGLFIMMIDKRKAIRRRRRVPEKKLFLIALLFGSVGMLVGMYLFHHKTRHKSFVIGIPAILVAQLLLLSFLFTWNNQRMGSPSQAVQYELELIQDLDADTIRSFVSYENLMNSHLDSGTIGPETTEAVELFFEHFRYDIINEEINGDEAVVTVSIRNLDMHELAVDCCTAILKQSVQIYPDQSTFTTSDYYRLLRDMLQNNEYPTKETTATFRLFRDESGWIILADQKLEDEIVSNFISCMNDPYILPASEVLDIQLHALKALTAEQWINYLDIQDIFATYNTDYSSLIDTAYAEQLAQHYDYKILRCSENGNTAMAAIRIHSTDMTHVLTLYREYLLDYAATTKSIRDDDVTFSNETAALLLKAFENTAQSGATDINLTFYNNGNNWDIFFDDTFTDAIMGGISEAMDHFNSVTKEAINLNPDAAAYSNAP